MSLPVTLKMALQAAGRMGGSPGLPSPASGLSIDQRHRQRASGVGIFQAANFGDVGMFKHRNRGRMAGHPELAPTGDGVLGLLPDCLL